MGLKLNHLSKTDVWALVIRTQQDLYVQWQNVFRAMLLTVELRLNNRDKLTTTVFMGEKVNSINLRRWDLIIHPYPDFSSGFVNQLLKGALIVDAT